MAAESTRWATERSAWARNSAWYQEELRPGWSERLPAARGLASWISAAAAVQVIVVGLVGVGLGRVHVSGRSRATVACRIGFGL